MGASRNLAVLFLAVLSCGALHAEDWHTLVTPAAAGDFPEVRPFVGDFRFGWSEIPSGGAHVRLDYIGDRGHVIASGGSTGIVRKLWAMTANHTAVFERHGFMPVQVEQVENYPKKKIHISIVEKPDGMWGLRAVTPHSGYPDVWRKVKASPALDMVSAMLFIRSQRLAVGDHVGVVVYPGDTPYLVEVDVAKKEKISAAGRSWDALRLNLHIQKIDFSKNNKTGKLEPHPKFHSGRVWVSDDADRIPLRAEVDIFIGYVYGELDQIRFTGPAPALSIVHKAAEPEVPAAEQGTNRIPISPAPKS